MSGDIPYRTGGITVFWHVFWLLEPQGLRAWMKNIRVSTETTETYRDRQPNCMIMTGGWFQKTHIYIYLHYIYTLYIIYINDDVDVYIYVCFFTNDIILPTYKPLMITNIHQFTNHGPMFQRRSQPIGLGWKTRYHGSLAEGPCWPMGPWR